MTNRILATSLLLTLLGVFIVGCSSTPADTDPTPEPSAALEIQLRTFAQKTLWPSGWVDSIGDFRVVIHTAGVQDSLHTKTATEAGTVRFDDMEPGLYDIAVTALCSDSNYCDDESVIGHGLTEEVNVAPDVTNQATVIVRPYDQGEGSATVTLGWASECDVNKVEVFMRELSAGAWPATPVETREGVELDAGEYEFTMANSPAGSYVLGFYLYHDDFLVSTAIETVNIYGNYRTVGTITLTAADCMAPPVDPALCGDGYDLHLDFLGATPGQSVYFASECNGWDPAATELALDDTPFLLPNGVNNDGILEFQIIGEQGNWSSCWWFNPDVTSWSLLNAVASGLSGNNCQVTVDCSAHSALTAIAVTIDIDNETLVAQCLVATGLDVTIETDDPSEEAPLELSCTVAGNEVSCTAANADGLSDQATFSWYVNGVRMVGYDSATEVFFDLEARDRIAVVVSDGAWGASAQWTVPS